MLITQLIFIEGGKIIMRKKIIKGQLTFFDILEVKKSKQFNEIENDEVKELILSNLRLVASIARKSNINFDDAYQGGCIGLITAAKKFDKSKGYKFSTYAYNWIKQGIIRYQGKRLIQLPENKIQQLLKAQRIKENLEKTDENTAIKAGIKASDVSLLNNQVLSLEYMYSGKDGEKADLFNVVSNADSVEDICINNELKNEIRNTLNKLTPKQKFIICKKYGLDGGSPMTYKKIGNVIGMSPQNVSKLEKKILSGLEKSELKEYV